MYLTYSQLIDKAETPISGSVLGHISIKLLVICLANIVWHSHSLVNGIGKLFSVPRIHNNRTIKRLSCTSKFRQDQDTMCILLCCNVLVGDQVHTVSG